MLSILWVGVGVGVGVGVSVGVGVKVGVKVDVDVRACVVYAMSVRGCVVSVVVCMNTPLCLCLHVCKKGQKTKSTSTKQTVRIWHGVLHMCSGPAQAY